MAYGSALPILAGQTSHGMEIPPGYASVGVEQLADSQYEGLELELPGGDGERTLGDALSSRHRSMAQTLRHHPRHRGITAPRRTPAATISSKVKTDFSTTACHQDRHHRDRRFVLDQGLHLHHILVTTTPGLRAAPSKEPAAPLKKSRPPPPKPTQRKKKPKEPEVTPEERWEAMTHEERWSEIQAECRVLFRKRAEEKKAREMVPQPVDPNKYNFLLRCQNQSHYRT